MKYAKGEKQSRYHLYYIKKLIYLLRPLTETTREHLIKTASFKRPVRHSSSEATFCPYVLKLPSSRWAILSVSALDILLFFPTFFCLSSICPSMIDCPLAFVKRNSLKLHHSPVFLLPAVNHFGRSGHFFNGVFLKQLLQLYDFF